MQVILNGQKIEFNESAKLKDIVYQFCANPQHVLVEINGTVIKSHSWQDHIVREGDTLELVSFVGGG